MEEETTGFKLANMKDTELKLDFYLTCLEEQVKCELEDSNARLTQSSTEGRVLLDIQEDSLINLLEQLQEPKKRNNWSQEKEMMEREICRLKALLNEVQDKHIHSSQNGTETLQSELKKTKRIVQRVQYYLQEQTSQNRDLQLKVEALQREKEALQDEVEAMKLEVQPKQLQTTTQVQIFDKDTAEFEAHPGADLEADLAFERAQTEKLRKNLDKMKAALLKEKEDAKKTEQRFQASQQAQLEELTAENSKFRAAHKKAEELLETERLHSQQQKTLLEEENKHLKETLYEKKQWQQAKTSRLEKMERSRAFSQLQLDQGTNELVAALKEVELQLERNCLKQQEETSSLLQSSNELMRTVQEKEQEMETTETCLKARLEELERKVSKKKKKKWYRKFF